MHTNIYIYYIYIYVNPLFFSQVQVRRMVYTITSVKYTYIIGIVAQLTFRELKSLQTMHSIRSNVIQISHVVGLETRRIIINFSVN